jgi:hypothetical protein
VHKVTYTAIEHADEDKEKEMFIAFVCYNLFTDTDSKRENLSMKASGSSHILSCNHCVHMYPTSVSATSTLNKLKDY